MEPEDSRFEKGNNLQNINFWGFHVSFVAPENYFGEDSSIQFKHLSAGEVGEKTPEITVGGFTLTSDLLVKSAWAKISI